MMRPRTSRRRGRREGAFTIVEVLATLALAAIVLPAVVHGVLLCLSVAGYAHDQAQAAALAQSKLADLLTNNETSDAEATGDFGEDYPGYAWTARVDDWTDDRLVQVDVAVTWTRRGQSREVVLSTLVYTGQPLE